MVNMILFLSFSAIVLTQGCTPAGQQSNTAEYNTSVMNDMQPQNIQRNTLGNVAY
ncbi:MAG: hypothetical protein JNN05_10310 [Candidatus Omnitrophica bacterium]|nr:hypothetical protein [Candidatus Omnitrophota bacterium]